MILKAIANEGGKTPSAKKSIDLSGICDTSYSILLEVAVIFDTKYRTISEYQSIFKSETSRDDFSGQTSDKEEEKEKGLHELYDLTLR